MAALRSDCSLGKAGRIRREGMGKRVNFCARSVVTSDSYIDADEILVPRGVASRLTYPVVVHPYNLERLTARLRAGGVLFLQRAGQPRLRAIGHIAVLACDLDARDCIVRRNRKYPLLRPPLPTVEDIPLPIQCHVDGTETALCFGDRLLRQGALVDPLQCVTWPVLEPGDTVLVAPQDGDWCLMNRQPTLVQESMLGMRIRLGPSLSFGATCGPIEALRGDYDFVNHQVLTKILIQYDNEPSYGQEKRYGQDRLDGTDGGGVLEAVEGVLRHGRSHRLRTKNSLGAQFAGGGV